MAVKKVILPFLIILILFTGCGDSTKNKIKKNLKNIEKSSNKAMTDEQIEESINEYYSEIEEIQQRYMQISIWNKMLGLRLLDNKEYGPALQYFQKALEITPDNPVLYYYVGECAVFLGNIYMDISVKENIEKRTNYYYLAEESFLKAISLDPNYTNALLGLGILYSCQMSDCNTAIPYLDKLLSIDKKNVDAMFLLARCYYFTKQYDLALMYYDKIIEFTKDESKRKTAQENKTIVLNKAYED